MDGRWNVGTESLVLLSGGEVEGRWYRLILLHREQVGNQCLGVRVRHEFVFVKRRIPSAKTVVLTGVPVKDLSTADPKEHADKADYVLFTRAPK